MNRLLILAFILLPIVTASIVSTNNVQERTTSIQARVPFFATASEKWLLSSTSSDGLASMNAAQVGEILTAVQLKSGQYPALVNMADSTPEVVVAIVYDKLSLSSIIENPTEFEYINTLISSAQSSFYVSAVEAQSVDNLASYFSSHSLLDATEAGDCPNVPSEYLSNGVTDLVIVQIKVGTSNSCIGSILSLKVPHIALVTSSAPSQTVSHSFKPVFTTMSLINDADSVLSHTPHQEAVRKPSHHQFRTMSIYPNDSHLSWTPIWRAVNTTRNGVQSGYILYPGPQYINPAIFFALIVALFLLFILYCAVSCLMSVQRPVRLSAVPLILAKDY